MEKWWVERCDKCYFWDSSTSAEGVGRCKRYPRDIQNSPVTFEDNWCGEFRDRESIVEKRSLFNVLINKEVG